MLSSRITAVGRPYLAFKRSVRIQAFRRGISLVSTAQSKSSNSSILSLTQKKSLYKPVFQSYRSFSITPARFAPSGTVDEELAAKLDSEISVETQMGDYDEMPANLKEFLESGQFTIKDRAGLEEVELVRGFGDENIRVIFSIADLNNMDEKYDDASLYEQEDGIDLPEETEAAARKPKGSKDAAAATEAEEEEEQEFEENPEPAYPARLNITIEKPNAGALQVEAIAQDGMIIIENVHYHQSAQLATAQSAEADWERRGLYVGPPFGNLDEDLQVLLERYLDERGINTSLAVFVPDYIDYKEQREYLSWLQNVKSFVEK